MAIERNPDRYDSQRKAANRWAKDNTKSITIKMYIKSDQDILDHLDKQDNRNAYIKSLIRADIAGRVLPDPDQQ